MSNIMKRLSRSSSFRSLRSNDSSASSSDNSAHTSLTQNIVNSQEINIAQIENQLHNWSIPCMKINIIYQQGKFEFRQNYSIKTEEKPIPLNQNLESLQLVSQNTINQHRKKFNYIHIVLIQAAIKPLFHLGLDIHVFAYLRYVRSTKFTDFVLNMIDSNIANGPVYFNYYPIFSMNINDPSILSSLTLNIKTKNMNFVEEAQTIAIIYRIYYKVMTTQLNPRVVCQFVKDETLLLHYNPNNTQAFVPKKLKWNEITQGG